MTVAESTSPTSGGGVRRPLPARTFLRRTVRIEPDHWYGLDDLAAHYDLPKSTVRELIVAGTIPAAKVGRTWRAYGADILRRDEELRRAASGPQGADVATVIPMPTRAATDSPESV